MNAYEPVMLWHLKEANLLRDHQTLGDYPHYIGRKAMIKKLVERYNFKDKLPFQKAMRLPVSGTLVRLTVHASKLMIISSGTEIHLHHLRKTWTVSKISTLARHSWKLTPLS